MAQDTLRPSFFLFSGILTAMLPEGRLSFLFRGDPMTEKVAGHSSLSLSSSRGSGRGLLVDDLQLFFLSPSFLT